MSVTETEREHFRRVIDGWILVGGDAHLRVYFDLTAAELEDWRRGLRLPNKNTRADILEYIRKRVERIDG